MVPMNADFEWNDGESLLPGFIWQFAVTIFGNAEIISTDTPEEYLHGLGVLAEQHGREKPLRITNSLRESLLILKIIACKVTGKAQYPLISIEDDPIPPLEN